MRSLRSVAAHYTPSYRRPRTKTVQDKGTHWALAMALAVSADRRFRKEASSTLLLREAKKSEFKKFMKIDNFFLSKKT